MKCATYLRVSTGEQSIDPQRLELNAIIAARGWMHVAEHSDVISGGTISRTGLIALMACCRAREYDAVLVVKIDRLARSIAHFVLLVDELLKLNIALVVPGQGIDTSSANPAAKLQMHVLAAVAEFERSIISERTKAGLACARAKGVRLGNYSRKLLPHWREIIAQWRVLPEDDRSYNKLAKALGGVSKSTAFRLAHVGPDELPPVPSP